MAEIALLLGAGFSRWAADLPLASELFDFQIRSLNDREERRLHRLVVEKEGWDKANPGALAPAEAFVEWSLEESSQRRSRVLWYVTRRLSDPFLAWLLGGVQTFQIDQNAARGTPGVKRAQSFLTRFVGPNSVGILTVNYDLLIEYALGTKCFTYGKFGEVLAGRGHNPMAPWQNMPVVIRGHVPVAKLHGSVSWDESARYTDGRCGLQGKALIVPPRAGKRGQELMADVWALGREILGKASHLIVFGFAFNPYDHDLLALLGEAGSQIKKVLLVDPYPALARAQAVWPAAEILSCAPPTRGTDTLPPTFYS